MKSFFSLRVLSPAVCLAALNLIALPSFAGTITVENAYERFPDPSTPATTTTTTNTTTTTTNTTTRFPSSVTRPGFTASLAALPNGLYRAVSPIGFGTPSRSPFQPERTFFTFRKLGNRVVGNLEYLDRTLLACVSGTVDDNVIVGEAVTNQDSSFVFGQNALTPTPSLRLGTFVAGNLYRNSVLDLGGFRRIDTGTVVPPSACFSR